MFRGRLGRRAADVKTGLGRVVFAKVGALALKRPRGPLRARPPTDLRDVRRLPSWRPC